MPRPLDLSAALRALQRPATAKPVGPLEALEAHALTAAAQLAAMPSGPVVPVSLAEPDTLGDTERPPPVA